jgi:hypothetical protein
MRHACLLLLLMMYRYSYTQDVSGSKKGTVRFNAFIGAGYSTFQTNIPAPYKFTSPEFRLGAGVSKPVSKVFEVRGRLSFGAKIKREAYNKPGQPYLVGPPFLELDEVASSRNHYFIEVPVFLQFNLPNPKIGIRVGGNYRFFFPNNKDVDFLTFRGDLGIVTGACWRMNDNISIGVDFLFGVTKVYTSGGYAGSVFSLDTRNRFSQITFEYLFAEKR